MPTISKETWMPPVTSDIPIQKNERGNWIERYDRIRQRTLAIAKPLTSEDAMVQSMSDVSPPKWHLAHTTWFFETFILAGRKGFTLHNPQWQMLFNSYYEQAGPYFPRSRRGLLSRPSLQQVLDYRTRTDHRIIEWLRQDCPPPDDPLLDILELGLNHEEQHQELMLTDILHIFSCNPLDPVYQPTSTPHHQAPALTWKLFESQIAKIGHNGHGFSFDQESPAHSFYIQSFQLANRPATCGDYLEFIEDGGYNNPTLWLSEGWHQQQSANWQGPMYWRQTEHEGWQQMTLSGLLPLDTQAPVAYVSFYEADAFARWRGCRLPGEQEWELAAMTTGTGDHNMFEQGRLRPSAACPTANHHAPLLQLYGDVWEWTGSAYRPYPGYWPSAGAIGEYNGKFMCNQMVLRGGSCLTPEEHIRPTYRNFFPPHARWQCMGLRLARDS